MGAPHHNSSAVPASNTDIYGPALTHPTQKNEPTNASGLVSSATNPTSSSHPTPSSGTQSSINPIGSPEHNSHYGRDTAIAGGAGAAGLGAYEASKHHDQTSSTPTQHTGNDGYGTAKILGTTTTGPTVRSSETAPGTTGISQLGPNAALGTGFGTSSTSRPGATSIPSNASMKSGVLGKVPSSELTKDSAGLSAVPPSGGKFMEGTSTT